MIVDFDKYNEKFNFFKKKDITVWKSNENKIIQWITSNWCVRGNKRRYDFNWHYMNSPWMNEAMIQYYTFNLVNKKIKILSSKYENLFDNKLKMNEFVLKSIERDKTIARWFVLTDDKGKTYITDKENLLCHSYCENVISDEIKKIDPYGEENWDD